MLRMGFQDGWVDMIIRCVSSVSYKVMHDGQDDSVMQSSSWGVSHLLFVDDSYPFFKASSMLCNYIKKLSSCIGEGFEVESKFWACLV